MTDGFTAWAHVEAMGHRGHWGLVSERQIAGASFLQVETFKIGAEEPSSVQMYPPSSIYCLTPCTEERARLMATPCSPGAVRRGMLTLSRWVPLPGSSEWADPTFDAVAHNLEAKAVGAPAEYAEFLGLPPLPTTTTVVARARTAPIVRATQAAPAVRVYPVGELQDMIRAGFSRFGAEVAEQAIRVAGCESTGDESGQRLNPQAVNGQHAGLFQISRTYHEARATRLGFTWAQMWEPGPNIAVAADLFSESRWGPWTCRWAAA